MRSAQFTQPIIPRSYWLACGDSISGYDVQLSLINQLV